MRIIPLPLNTVSYKFTGQADVILANSQFTAGVFKSAFPSISAVPRVVYPGINISAYNNTGEISSDLNGVEQYAYHLFITIVCTDRKRHAFTGYLTNPSSYRSIDSRVKRILSWVSGHLQLIAKDFSKGTQTKGWNMRVWSLQVFTHTLTPNYKS